MNRQTFKEQLESITHPIMKLNYSMRFADAAVDLDKVAQLFNAAERQFFLSTVKQAPDQADYRLSADLDDFSLRFADVSYYANRYTPSAVPISAEAVDQARRQLGLIPWFDSGERNHREEFTQFYETF